MTTAELAPPAVPPRPSVALVIVSVLVMCGCAAVVGSAAAFPFVHNFAPLICVSFPVVAVTLFVGVNQFLGTFRLWPGSALVAGLAILFLGTLWLIMVSMVVLERPPAARQEPIEVFLMILFGAFLLGAGMLNLLWQIRLIRVTPSPAPLPLARFSFRELFLFMTLVAVMLSSTGYLLRQVPPRWGENAKPTQVRYDLPPQAKQVCFSRTDSSIAVEFNLDEAGFRRWVQEDHPYDERWQTPLVPISTTYEIPRYRKLNGLAAAKPIAKINRGLYLEWRNLGNSLQVVYDEENEKVYMYEGWISHGDH